MKSIIIGLLTVIASVASAQTTREYEDAARRMNERQAQRQAQAEGSELGKLRAENAALRKQVAELQQKLTSLTAQASTAAPSGAAKPTGSPVTGNVRSSEDVPFALIKSDTQRFAGRTITVVAAAVPSDYYNYSWTHAEPNYYSFDLREVTESATVGEGGKAYLLRTRGDSLIRAAAAASTSTAGGAKLAHLKVVICPHTLEQYENAIDSMEIVAWQFRKADDSGWDEWQGEVPQKAAPAKRTR